MYWHRLAYLQTDWFIYWQDKEKGRFSLSTKTLEAEPGDMVTLHPESKTLNPKPKTLP